MSKSAKTSRRRPGLVIGAVGFALLGGYFVQQPEQRPAPAAAAPESAARVAMQRRLQLLGDAEAKTSTLSGSVYSGGTPVAGALVCAACVSCEATTAGPAPCTESAEDGSYAFSELTPRGYFLNATAPGFVPNTANSGEPIFVLPEQTREDVDIELSEGGARLTGHVVDATGGPIAGARVRAVRAMPPRMSLDSHSDADGRFAFALRPGFIQLVAEADGYARASLRATAPGDVELRLVPGSSVEGTVVRAGTDTPVSHVEVKAISSRTPQPALAPSDISDAEGRFQVHGLEPGRYLLQARGERSRGRLRQMVQLGVAEHLDGLVVEVQRASQVNGRVTIDGQARPCRQGSVSLGDPSPLEPLPSAEHISRVTGGSAIERATGPGQAAHIRADGSVWFEGVAPGSYFVRVSCHGYRLHSGPRVVRVGHEPLEDLAWTVVPAGQAVVRVVDERDEPVAQADIYVEFPSRGPRVVSSYRTDAQGRVTVRGLRPGEHKVHAPDGYEQVDPVRFRVPDAASELEVTLRLPGSGFALVHVVSDQEKPIDGLWLKAVAAGSSDVPAEGARGPKQARARPLGQGRYRIGPLTEGLYHVAIHDGVHPPIDGGQLPGTQLRVTRGEVVRTHVRLQRGGTIEGQVLDAHGEPAPDVWVTVAADAAPKHMGATQATTAARARPQRVLSDVEGRFSIEGLAPDASFRVRATQPYGSATVRGGVRPGEQVKIRLPQTATLSGVAIDSRGRPITQLKVRAWNAAVGSSHSETFADPEGRFSLSRVAPGTVRLALFGAGGRSATTSLDIAPGEHLADLRFELQPAAAGLAEDAAPRSE